MCHVDVSYTYNIFMLKGSNLLYDVHLSLLHFLYLIKRKTLSLSAVALNEKIYSLSWFSFSDILHMVKQGSRNAKIPRQQIGRQNTFR